VSTPEVVAHRGATDAEAPEHTMAAYRQAAAVGADAVECDVRMTRDGVLVCVHDRRVHRTSNGRGVVSTLHLAELEQMQFGPRRSRRSPWKDDEITVALDEPDLENGTVLTLERLLEYVTATPDTVRLAIETKHPTRHARRVEQELVRCLRRFGLLDGDRPVEWRGKPAFRVMSFSQLAVRRVRALAPGVPTVQLIGKRLRPVRTDLLSGSMSAVGPGLALLRAHPDYVAQAHAAGKQVHVWVANEPEDVDFLHDLGVDALITDRPGDVLRHIGRGPRETGLPA